MRRGQRAYDREQERIMMRDARRKVAFQRAKVQVKWWLLGIAVYLGICLWLALV